MRRRTILALAAPFAAACGYRVGGKADLLPDTIHTIAIPPFGKTQPATSSPSVYRPRSAASFLPEPATVSSMTRTRPMPS